MGVAPNFFGKEESPQKEPVGSPPVPGGLYSPEKESPLVNAMGERSFGDLLSRLR